MRESYQIPIDILFFLEECYYLYLHMNNGIYHLVIWQFAMERSTIFIHI